MIIHGQFLRLQREIILQYSSVTSYFDGLKKANPLSVRVTNDVSQTQLEPVGWVNMKIELFRVEK